MINLQFLEIYIQGFQSIGSASIDFDNLGTCYIRGINNYDSKTKSNGSGKSSLMSSLHWVLFGKTPAGIGNDVVNKFSDTGCCVELAFKVDGVKYVIRRSQNHHKFKTNLVILKESEDISGRNKSDSEKVIREIIKIDEEVFSQMIFLSQGFANRFAIYTPKARKELLESLYSINERLDDFISGLKIKESTIKNDIDDKSRKILELNTKNQMIQNVINTNIDNINNTDVLVNQLMSTKSNITKEDIDSIQKHLDDLSSQVDKINEKYTVQYNKTLDINRQLIDLSSQKQKLEQEIKGFSNNKICPTCGTLLEDYEHNEHIQNHILELTKEIENITVQINSLHKEYDEQNDIAVKMSNKLSNIRRNRDNVKFELSEKNSEYQKELQKDTQIKAYRDKIVEYNQNINNAQDSIIANESELTNLSEIKTNKEKDLEIMQHSIRLANNQFKSYLLENIVNLLNKKLSELSVSLFENEVIRIDGDNKLDIYIGDKTYEQCSGGEQRRVDVAIIIAQRFLAQQMNAISANILILDEVFDGLDDTSFGIVLDLLSDEIQDVESTFIISHRDIKEIPFDKIITVTKNENQISDIELS